MLCNVGFAARGNANCANTPTPRKSTHPRFTSFLFPNTCRQKAKDSGQASVEAKKKKKKKKAKAKAKPQLTRAQRRALREKRRLKRDLSDYIRWVVGTGGMTQTWLALVPLLTSLRSISVSNLM